jgi:hypothetical protein
MKNRNSSREIDDSWAGSKPGDLTAMSGNGRLAETKPGEWQRLYDLKHKLADDRYVDGAVARIASFLSGKMKEGKNDE